MKAILILCMATLIISCQQKPTISEWRGPDRSGIYPESNLLDEWPADGPQLVLELNKLGNGYSSPVFANDFMYITGEIDSLGYLFKFDRNGKQVWKTNYGKEWTQNFFGSRGTPTIADSNIYLCSGMGDICCIDLETGKIKWNRHLIADYDGVIPRFGYSQALVIDGDQLFCIPGGKENNVISLNRFSGDLIWSCKAFSERPGYNPAKLINHNDSKILVTFSAYHLFGIDILTGKLLWNDEQNNTKPEDRKPGIGDTHANTVLYRDGAIYYAAGDGNLGVKLSISEDGKSIERNWQCEKLDNFMSGIICDGKKLYGSSHQKRQLIAIDCENGLKTDSLKIGRGSTIMADNKIFFYNERGHLHLVDVTNSQLKDISSFKLNKGSREHFSHPVIHQGILYIRHGNYLGGYQISKNS